MTAYQGQQSTTTVNPDRRVSGLAGTRRKRRKGKRSVAAQAVLRATGRAS